MLASHLSSERDELLLFHDLLDSLHDLGVKGVVNFNGLSLNDLLYPALPCEFFVTRWVGFYHLDQLPGSD